MAYRNPTPTVDVVVHRIHNDQLEVLLIERANPPHGWALPGGFVDEGERVERQRYEKSKKKLVFKFNWINCSMSTQIPNEIFVNTTCHCLYF